MTVRVLSIAYDSESREVRLDDDGELLVNGNSTGVFDAAQAQDLVAAIAMLFATQEAPQ